jgi:NADP-dependent 3-hydroxy acid dehydrogenase YdfG
MNRIILAYAPENSALAEHVDQALSRIGIPFEHANAAVAEQIASAGEPVLLLVTDNFLTNQACMTGLLPVLQTLVAQKRLVAVLADGIDAAGEPVHTEIDRMSNALHYMKHWQDVWLAMSDQHQHATGETRAALVAELDATRALANTVGDLISTLREAGYMTWQQFEANDFEAFFLKFELQDWHGQYKRLVAQAAEQQNKVEASRLPEMPVLGGFLTPEPVLTPELDVPGVDAPPSDLRFQFQDGQLDVPAAPASQESAMESPEQESKITLLEEEQAVRDAWFWIEKGYYQRGMELFQIALEQYPKSEWLNNEYKRASLPSNPIEVSTEPEQASNPVATVTPDSVVEAKSYDLMGDMAAEKGDYLFAKYCWDRVADMDPGTPNICRKLGLMTAEHLRDYRETALIYLRKALEIHENDSEVKLALAELLREGNVNTETVANSTPLEIATLTPEPTADPADTAGEQVVEIQATGHKKQDSGPGQHNLVLITGATSGIGRATAEIFAHNGYRLILTGRRAERLHELKQNFEAKYGTAVLILPFDVRDQAATEAALSNLPESFREIDILVNNAGLAKGLAPIHEGNLDHWETMIDTNIKGLLYVTRLISPGMVSRRRGHIINLGSSASKEAYPNGNVYCATKFAVEALTKSMRFDLYAHNIRVSQVSPGHVEETEFAITRFDGDADRAKIYDDFQPLKSSDVAEAIYFMATRPPHVNIQDIQLFATQQASSMVIDRSGRYDV